MNGANLIMGALVFWLVLGGLFQLFDIDNENELNEAGEIQDTQGLLSATFDLLTFNVSGIPESIRWSITILMSFIVGLGIYVLLPFTGN